MSNKYVHLHFHTEYSMLDGANKLKNVVKQIDNLGMEAVAITDHGNMFGAIDFYQTIKKYNKEHSKNIKPIIGIEAYLTNVSEISSSNNERYHLCLYAKNEIGYKNLMYLSSFSYTNFYRKPRITKELLKKYKEGLVCSSACLGGEINFHLNNSNQKNQERGSRGYERAKEIALEYREIFGEDFYLELMRHGISDQKNIDDQIVKLSRELNIKIVATNDVHYTKKADSKHHNILMAIGTGSTVSESKLKHTVTEFYIKSADEMAELFADIPEALTNTLEVADKCNLKLNLGKPTPPNYKFTLDELQNLNIEPIEAGQTFSHENDNLLFKYRAELGLEERLKLIESEDKKNSYRTRLKFEIETIQQMKFSGYMLIVWDFIRSAENLKVPVGPGRGSVAGALVAYALKITDIDPIKYGLLFERFLNSERVSMPDIDMDFAQDSRNKIIEYVRNKYGHNNVAQVSTFSSLLAKGVLRDVARVMEISLHESEKFTKLIPNKLGITLEEALKLEPRIQEQIESDELFAKLWETATALEGIKRNSGVHAAGVVISNDELWNKTPLLQNDKKNGMWITQYSLNFLEDVDLIKFDFLGLKTLDVIRDAVKIIENNKNIKINWNNIDVNDSKVYSNMSTGNTVGMFQIESSGMQELNRKLQPSNFEDLIALIALYRPGPMEAGMLDDFIERKHQRQNISYPFEGIEFPEQLKDILEPTYGVIVYQEQVIKIVQIIGGFSPGKADIVRRAMGKKKIEEMTKYGNEFADGAEKLNLNRYIAEELFKLIEKFAGYGFNKSHSAAYAMITFQTAYLKTYFPAEFMASLLSSESGNLDKISAYIDEIKRLNITIEQPDLNLSDVGFKIVNQKNKESILFGLGSIKGIGDGGAEAIVEERTKNSIFLSLENFLDRISSYKINKRVLEALIKIGALSKLENANKKRYNIKTLFISLDKLLKELSKISSERKNLIGSLFDEESFDNKNKIIALKEVAEFSKREILDFEKELLNIYISGHPLDSQKSKIESYGNNIGRIINIQDLSNASEIFLIGIIEIIEEKVGKKTGSKYATAKIIDISGEIHVTIFSENLQKFNLFTSEIRHDAVGIRAMIKFKNEDNDDETIQQREINITDIIHPDEINKELYSSIKLNKIKDKIESFNSLVSRLNQLDHLQNGDEVIIIAIIKVDEKIAKNGNPYAKAIVTDISGTKILMMFKDVLEEFKNLSEDEQKSPLVMIVQMRLKEGNVKDFNINKFLAFEDLEKINNFNYNEYRKKTVTLVELNKLEKNWQEEIVIALLKVEEKISKIGNKYARVRAIDSSGIKTFAMFDKTLNIFQSLSEHEKNSPLAIIIQLKIKEDKTIDFSISKFLDFDKIKNYHKNKGQIPNQNEISSFDEYNDPFYDSPNQYVMELQNKQISKQSLIFYKQVAETNPGQNRLILNFNKFNFDFNTGLNVDFDKFKTQIESKLEISN